MTRKQERTRLAKAEKRLSEIERLIGGHASTPRARDYISRGDWFPTVSDRLKERGNDHPRAGLQRQHSK